MTLKQEVLNYLQELADTAEFEPEDISTAIETVAALNDSLSNGNKWDKSLILRMISDDALYDKIDKAIVIRTFDKNVFD